MANSVSGDTKYLEQQILNRAFDETTNSLRSFGGDLITQAYDRVDVSYPSSTTEVYTFRASGVVISTVTVTYTDSTKENISSVVKS